MAQPALLQTLQRAWVGRWPMYSSIVSITLAFIPGACLWEATQTRVWETPCLTRQGGMQVLEPFWKHQRLWLGESLVRTRRAIPCPYTCHFNHRLNKTCRSKKAKIIGLIKLYKLWTKVDSQCFCPCQGKGAYLAWGKRIWGEWRGGWWGCAMATEEGASSTASKKTQHCQWKPIFY